MAGSESESESESEPRGIQDFRRNLAEEEEEEEEEGGMVVVAAVAPPRGTVLTPIGQQVPMPGSGLAW